MNPVTDILARAVVPEHSAPFMQAVSGGRVLTVDNFVFYAAEDWLMAIAYPLRDGGEYSHQRFEAALSGALRETGATACFAVGPDLPPRLADNVLERDEFYTLPADAPVPPRLRSPVRKARERLRIDETREFGPQHRRLWAEFMGRAVLRANVRELFARTPQMLAAEGADVRLLNAWEGDRLVACLVLDYSTPAFVSYIVGARSRSHPVPHAGDALFAVMLEKARAAGCDFVQLGLGVNEGITRFKRKWGGAPQLPYVMAQWQERPRADVHKVVLDELMQALVERSDEGLSKRQILDDSWRNNRGDKSGITRDEPGHSETAFCNIVAWDENGKGGRSLPFFVSAKQVTGRYFRIFLPSMRRFISARVAVSTTLA